MMTIMMTDDDDDDDNNKRSSNLRGTVPAFKLIRLSFGPALVISLTWPG